MKPAFRRAAAALRRRPRADEPTDEGVGEERGEDKGKKKKKRFRLPLGGLRAGSSRSAVGAQTYHHSTESLQSRFLGKSPWFSPWKWRTQPWNQWNVRQPKCSRQLPKTNTTTTSLHPGTKQPLQPLFPFSHYPSHGHLSLGVHWRIALAISVYSTGPMAFLREASQLAGEVSRCTQETKTTSTSISRSSQLQLGRESGEKWGL